jgi:hypothetical protein
MGEIIFLESTIHRCYGLSMRVTKSVSKYFRDLQKKSVRTMTPARKAHLQRISSLGVAARKSTLEK